MMMIMTTTTMMAVMSAASTATVMSTLQPPAERYHDFLQVHLPYLQGGYAVAPAVKPWMVMKP